MSLELVQLLDLGPSIEPLKGPRQCACDNSQWRATIPRRNGRGADDGKLNIPREECRHGVCSLDFDNAQIDSFGEIISAIDGHVERKIRDVEAWYREIDSLDGFSGTLGLQLGELLRCFGRSLGEGRRNHAKDMNEKHDETRCMQGSFSRSVRKVK